MKIEAILFDMIGTTVEERTPNTIITCFEKAFQQYGIDNTATGIKAHRGKDKMEMIRIILEESNYSLSLSKSIYDAFKNNVRENVASFVTCEGVPNILRTLRKQKIKIGLGSGLPRDLFEIIFSHLHWDKVDFDYIGISEEIGEARPHPAMIFDMMFSLGLNDKKAFLKVGDTVADIEEGKNAGVVTAAVLSGTQNEALIRLAEPDFILRKINAILSINI